MLEIWSFFGTMVTELQSKLPLKNELLRQLGCLNPLKKNDGFTVSAVEKLSSLLHPKLNTSEVVDEWKLFQVDNDNPRYNGDEQIEKFWNGVFDVLQPSGEKRYKLLRVIVKSALVLGQINAEYECSLSVNARVVTQDRSLLNEETVIGLGGVKEAVWIHDPISHQPEKIFITEELKRYVRSTYTSYQEWLKREQEEKEGEKEEAEKRKAISEKVQKERDILLEKKASMFKAE